MARSWVLGRLFWVAGEQLGGTVPLKRNWVCLFWHNVPAQVFKAKSTWFNFTMRTPLQTRVVAFAAQTSWAFSHIGLRFQGELAWGESMWA